VLVGAVSGGTWTGAPPPAMLASVSDGDDGLLDGGLTGGGLTKGGSALPFFSTITSSTVPSGGSPVSWGFDRTPSSRKIASSRWKLAEASRATQRVRITPAASGFARPLSPVSGKAGSLRHDKLIHAQVYLP